MTTPSAAIPVKQTSFSYCPSAATRTPADPPSYSLRSRSIPISTQHMGRTPSEVQLCVDEAIAEHRDNLFYTRLVEGIMMRGAEITDANDQQRYQQCLTRLARTKLDRFSSNRHNLMGFNEISDEDDSDDWSPGLSEEGLDFDEADELGYPCCSESSANADPNANQDSPEEVHEDIFEFEL